MPDVTAGVGYPGGAAPVAAGNPLEMLGQIIRVQGMQQQQRIAQQTMQSKQAIGQALQASSDPQTGEMDFDKFFKHAAMNPDAALALPEVTEGLVRSQNLQADTANKLLQANGVRYEALGSGMAAATAAAEEEAQNKVKLFNSGPGFGSKTGGTPQMSAKALAGVLSNFIGENGLVDSKDAAEILKKTSTLSDVDRFKYAKNFATSALNAKDVLDKTYGAIQANQFGGGTSFNQSNQLAGTNPQVGKLDQTLTPEGLNANVGGINAQGQQVYNPRFNAGPVFTGGGQQMPGSGQGSPVTGLSPGEAKSQEGRAGIGVDYEDQLNKDAIAAQNTQRVLNEMKDAKKDFQTGGGMKIRGQLSGVLQGMGVTPAMVNAMAGGGKDAYTALTEFNKLAFTYATARLGTEVPGAKSRATNFDLNSVFKASPGLEMDPKAIDKIFNYAQHGLNQTGAEVDAFNRFTAKDDKGRLVYPRPKGYEGATAADFPRYWSQILAKVNAVKDEGK